MPHPEDRAWWTDVQHLRPEARAAAAAGQTGPGDASAPADRAADRSSRGAPGSAAVGDAHGGAPARPPAGRPEAGRRSALASSARQHAIAPTERLTRSDAAGFAAAFDLDGDWGRPQPRSMTIVLERTAPDVDVEAVELEDEDWLEERRDARLPVRTRDLHPAAPRDRPAPARRPDRLDHLSDELVGSTSVAAPDAGPGAVVRRATAEPVVAARTPLPRAARTRRLTRRPQPTPVERLVQRPDRIALWAVALGVLLIVIAAFSGNAQAASTSPSASRATPQTRVVAVPAATAARLAIRR